MDRCTYINLAGKNYPLSFSLGAAKKLIMKYGSIEKMKTSINKEGDDVEKLDTVMWMLELLIAQGCAYKNYFEKDIPAPENAPVINGKWTPIAKEVIEIAIMISDTEELVKKIEECINKGSKKKVEARAERKNGNAAQG